MLMASGQQEQYIILIPVYIPTYLNVEADYLSQGRLVPVYLFPHIAQMAFQLRVNQSKSCLHLHISYHHTTPRRILSLAAFGFSAFNHPSMYWLCISSSGISFFQV